MPVRFGISLALILLCFAGFNADAAKGPVMVNIDVAPGVWKSIRLRNLPQGAHVALEIRSDGEVMVSLVNSDDYRRFSDAVRPLFMGRLKDKLSFSVSIPKSDDYYLVIDNRLGRRSRAITVTAGAERGKADSIDAANAILRQFEHQLHQIFIFDTFHFGIEDCDVSETSNDASEIVFCVDYLRRLYKSIGNMQKAKDALSFSVFQELGRILLVQWNHPAADQASTAEEFAAVLMIMLKQTQALSAHARNTIQNPSISRALTEAPKNHLPPLNAERAKEVLHWLQDPQFVVRWQKFLVPHMQTLLLKKLQHSPTPWTDSALVEKELARRSDKQTYLEPECPLGSEYGRLMS